MPRTLRTGRAGRGNGRAGQPDTARPADPHVGVRPVGVRHVAVRATVTLAAAGLLLSGCDAREAASDIADEFGNARQVSEKPDATATASADPATGLAEEDDPSASPGSPAAPETLPTFDTGTVVGGYAPDFPQGLLPTPKDAELLATSAALVPDTRPATVQVTLNLSSKRLPPKLMEQVRAALAKKGFEALEAPAESGMAEQAAFTRTTTVKESTVDESLLVGVLRDGDRSLLTLSGTVARPKDA
ncbi:hypothetical protein [Myceligenerans cantabricum]